MPSLTLHKLEELKKLGKIRGVNLYKPGNVPTITINKKGKGDAAKDWIFWNLWYLCENKKLTLATEFKFDDKRKFRFDYCIIESRIGIEYEGLMSEKSVHTTVKGYTGNCDKYNLATCSGWKVLRYTALNYKEVLNDIKKIING